MKTYLFCLLLCLVMTTACNQQNKSSMQQTSPSSHDKKEAFKNVKFDNTNDLVCGMPLKAGVGDTAHYNGKVYGFCSKGCKDKFVKNPADYVEAQ